MKNPWVVIGLVVVVLIGGSVAYAQWAAQSANAGVEVIDVHAKGNPDAEVVLAKYSDFWCPACAQAHPFIKQLVEEYEDDLRFEYIHTRGVRNTQPVPFYAAEAAGQQGAFFEFHDLLFENHNQWRQSGNPGRIFEQYAEELGLDVAKWKTHQRSSLLRNKVNDDFRNATAAGINATPTFTLNGQRLEITTFNDVRMAVEEALGVQPEAEQMETFEIELGDVEAGGDGELDVEFGI